MKAWHFVSDKLRDGRDIPENGVVLKHEDKLKPCKSGLHASIRLIDALWYSPGSTICRVECDGEILQQEDKLVCSERTILWRVDAEDLLRDFARWCAYQVIDEWDCPEIVRERIETGDEKLRSKTNSATYSAASSAASSAAYSSAYSVASSAASSAAYSSAYSATYSAASSAAYSAACSMANSAANSAAYSAAYSATYSTANSEAYSAAKAAQNTQLEKMVNELHEETYEKWTPTKDKE